MENAFVLFDEVTDVELLKKIVGNFRGCKGVWAVLNNGEEDKVKEDFPEFTLIQLDKALRNTKAITKEVKQSKAGNYELKNSLNSSVQIVEHMPEGKPVITIKRDGNEDFKGMFNRAMEKLTIGTKALICICGYSSEQRKVAQAITSFFEEEMKPLIYIHRESELNDREEDIEEWVTNPSSFKGRHLMANEGAVPGFEAEEIIGIGKNALKYFISRARVKFIHIDDKIPEYNWTHNGGPLSQQK